MNERTKEQTNEGIRKSTNKQKKEKRQACVAVVFAAIVVFVDVVVVVIAVVGIFVCRAAFSDRFGCSRKLFSQFPSKNRNRQA